MRSLGTLRRLANGTPISHKTRQRTNCLSSPATIRPLRLSFKQFSLHPRPYPFTSPLSRDPAVDQLVAFRTCCTPPPVSLRDQFVGDRLCQRPSPTALSGQIPQILLRAHPFIVNVFARFRRADTVKDIAVGLRMNFLLKRLDIQQ